MQKLIAMMSGEGGGGNFSTLNRYSLGQQSESDAIRITFSGKVIAFSNHH